MRILPWLTRLLLALLIGACNHAAAEETGGRTDEIKAVFIYKFTGYVTWPGAAADDFTIAVLGDSPLIGPLKEIARKRTIGPRKIVIRECTTVDEITGAQILFIADAWINRLEPLLRKSETERILTVGGSPGLAEAGVAINFMPMDERIGFEMNLAALERSGLAVSSQLMKLAVLVDDARSAPSVTPRSPPGETE